MVFDSVVVLFQTFDMIYIYIYSGLHFRKEVVIDFLILFIFMLMIIIIIYKTLILLLSFQWGSQLVGDPGYSFLILYKKFKYCLIFFRWDLAKQQ